MQQLDYSKVYGPDKIPGCLPKETAVKLSSPLIIIFRAYLKQGPLPEDWNMQILPVVTYSYLQVLRVTHLCQYFVTC